MDTFMTHIIYKTIYPQQTELKVNIHRTVNVAIMMAYIRMMYPTFLPICQITEINQWLCGSEKNNQNNVQHNTNNGSAPD